MVSDLRVQVGILLAICSVMLFPFSVAASAADGVLTVGRITGNPKKNFPRVMAIGTYLVDRLADFGYTKVDVRFTKTAEEMAKLMATGEVDLISDTAYSTAYLMKHSGAVPLLREWRSGVSNYQSVLFEHVGAGIGGLNNLEGKVVAFEDPGSTSAFFLPSVQIKHAGLELVELPYPTNTPNLGKGQVGYVFALSEKNIALWVVQGRVHAGALADGDLRDLGVVSESIRNELNVFYASPPYPRAVLLVNGKMDQKLVDRISEILLKASEDSEGQAALKRYRKVTKYDVLPKGEITILHDLVNELN